MKPAQLAALARNQNRITAWFPTFASMQAGEDPQAARRSFPMTVQQAPLLNPVVPVPAAPEPVLERSPASISYVDLDALVIVNAEDPSLNGAELVDITPTEDRDLVTATYKNPTTGIAVTEILPVLRDEPDDPWWKRDGHCCESCALGHDCDGDNCSLDARASNPAPAPVRTVVTRRRSGIFSRG